MAENTVSSFSDFRVEGSGRVSREPKFFKKSGDKPAKLIIPVAFNARNYLGEKGATFFDVEVIGFHAEQADAAGIEVGTNIIVRGSAFPAKNHEEYQGWVIRQEGPLGASYSMQEVSVTKSERGGGSTRRRGGDGYEDDDIDESPRGRGRGRSRDDDEDEAPRGRGRGRGRSRGNDDDEDESPRRGRGRGRASDDDDPWAGGDDEDEAPRGRGRRGRGRSRDDMDDETPF